jgi:hypothetical protein
MGENGPTPEETIALLAILALGGVLLWRALRWFFTGPTTPNPWGPEIDEQINQPEAVPLCPRCLSPNPAERDFCEECGYPVGTYTNWLPYLQLFSLGHVLRTGVDGRYPLNWITFLGYLFLSVGCFLTPSLTLSIMGGLIGFLVFALFCSAFVVFWVFLLRNTRHLLLEDATQVGLPKG